MKLSIITINYNDVKGLIRTIDSVIRQTNRDFEFIIIDGGSDDGSTDVIRQNKEKITYWISEPDKGIYNAMNKGILHSNGEYCIFLNSGDCFCHEGVVEEFVRSTSFADIICGNILLSNGQKIEPYPAITLDTIFDHAICHQACFIRTTLMKKYCYDETLRIVADRKFFVQALILDNCTYETVKVDVANYDISGFSSQNPVASRLEYAKVLEELIPERIRLDYGKNKKGILYGDSPYNKLFAEIGLRQYRKPIYLMVSLLLRFIALFKKSASFIKDFPVKI